MAASAWLATAYQHCRKQRVLSQTSELQACTCLHVFMPSPHCSPCKARLLQTTATALTPPNHKFLTTQCHIQKKGLKSNQVTENKHRQDKKKIGNVLREVSLQTSQFVVDIHPASHCTVTKEKMDYQGSAPTFSYWAAGGWGRGGGGRKVTELPSPKPHCFT